MSEIFNAKNVPQVEGLRTPRITEGQVKNAQGKWVEKGIADNDRKRLYAIYVGLQKKLGKDTSIPDSFANISVPVLANNIRTQLSTALAKKNKADKPKPKSNE